jgi:hypothetical protein
VPLVDDLGVSQHSRRDLLDQEPGEVHHHGVVRVGLVALQHRELGIVLPGDPLVSEYSSDLVDPVEAPDHQTLQVELVGDAEVKGLIEDVMLRREGSCGGTPIDRLQHRRLHLEKAALVEGGADRRDHAAAQYGDLPRPLVGDQVQVALARASLDIGQAVPLLGQRSKALGEQIRRSESDRELPLLGAPHRSFDAQEVPHIDLPDEVEEIRGHFPPAHAHLDADAILDQLQEDELAEGTDGANASRNRRRAALAVEGLRVLSETFLPFPLTHSVLLEEAEF